MSLPTPFLDFISRLPADVLRDWLTDGLIRFHEKSSDGYQRVEIAFGGPTYSLGLETIEQRAVDFLLDIQAGLLPLQPNRFDHAVAGAIDLLALNSDSRNESLRDLIEVAINTKNSFAIDAIRNKLRIIDPSALRVVCSDAVHFLFEGNAQPQLVELGEFMLREIDFPFEISAHLLVGLCRLNIGDADNYALAAERKLQRQLEIVAAYPDRLDEFKQDFCAAVLVAPDKSSLVATLLRIPMYAKLLDGRLGFDDDYRDASKYHDDALIPITALNTDVRRTWRVPFIAFCAMALSSFAYRRRSISSKDTLDLLHFELESTPVTA